MAQPDALGFRPVTLEISGEKDLSNSLKLPSADDLRDIVVELYKVPSIDWGIGTSNTAAFSIPRDHWSKILGLFEKPAVCPRLSLHRYELGMVKFITKDGHTLPLMWYWTGKGNLQFSWRGIRCTRSADLKPTSEENERFLTDGGASVLLTIRKYIKSKVE